MYQGIPPEWLIQISLITSLSRQSFYNILQVFVQRPHIIPLRMGNITSHHHHDHLGSRTNSGLSSNTTSTSSSPICRSRSTRAPSTPRKFLGRRSRSLNASHKVREQNNQEPEPRPPIRIGYPYYEEVTLLAEKDEKRHKRHSLRRSMKSA